MQQGDGRDETRRFEGSGGPDETRRFEGPGGSDKTRRIEGSGGPAGPGASGGPVLDDRYRLEELLGAGGMADVHRATDLRLNRSVAVKIFRPGTDSDGERRFSEEAQLLANLSHPGLVAVHDFGVEHHRGYLVMELVDGSTLREILDRQRLPLEEVARVGADLARVLAHVHEQGVVHRDVKPSNVLLGREGRVQLADFGISRLVDASGLTAGEATLGTASYLAPEQVQGEWVGPPADVYALGLVLLEAVTGYVEYPGGGWETAVERLSRGPGVPDELPGRLRRALLAMTEHDPSGRPSAAQAAEMLAGAGAPHVSPEPPQRSRAARNVAIALGLVALVAVLAAVLFAGGDDEPGVAQPSATPTPTATEEPGDGSGAGDPAGDAPAGEDPAGQDPAGEDPAGEDPGGGEPGGDGSGDGPDLPNFDIPDAPELPDVPEVPDSAKSAWQRFTDWLTGFF